MERFYEKINDLNYNFVIFFVVCRGKVRMKYGFNFMKALCIKRFLVYIWNILFVYFFCDNRICV